MDHDVPLEFPRLVALMWRHIRRLAVAGALMGLAGCASETLFQSSFNSSAVGSQPSPTQAVGTVEISGDPGGVVIVGPVPNSTEHWVKITRPSVANNQAGISTLIKRRRGGFAFEAGVVTSLTAGATELTRTRMGQFIARSI